VHLGLFYTSEGISIKNNKCGASEAVYIGLDYNLSIGQ